MTNDPAGHSEPHVHDGHDRHEPGHVHAHGHAGHTHAPARFGAAFAIGAVLNTLLVVAQFGFGWIAHSTALLADAVHNLGDVLALLLAWGAAWVGRRAPSSRRTYGWGRASILAALINAVVLLVGVGAIGTEALGRLGDPAPVAGRVVIAVATAAIAVNGFTAWLFSRGGGDLNVRAAFQHMAADALVSAGVVAAAVLIVLTHWSWIDPLASLAIVVVIVAGTWTTLIRAANLSMDAVPEGVRQEDVAAYLAALGEVEEVHDLHIWALSTTRTALTAHLVTRPGAGDAVLGDACEGLRRRFGIDHATLQIETRAVAEACRLRPAEVI